MNSRQSLAANHHRHQAGYRRPSYTQTNYTPQNNRYTTATTNASHGGGKPAGTLLRSAINIQQYLLIIIVFF